MERGTSSHLHISALRWRFGFGLTPKLYSKASALALRRVLRSARERAGRAAEASAFPPDGSLYPTGFTINFA